MQIAKGRAITKAARHSLEQVFHHILVVDSRSIGQIAGGEENNGRWIGLYGIGR